MFFEISPLFLLILLHSLQFLGIFCRKYFDFENFAKTVEWKNFGKSQCGIQKFGTPCALCTQMRIRNFSRNTIT